VLEARGQGGVLEAGLAVAAFGCGGFAFAALARPLLAGIGQSRMVALGGALAALALFGLAAAPSAAVFVGAGLVLGLGFYMVHNTIQTRVTEVAPEARGSAVALHAFHFYVGQSLGPVAVGAASGLLGPGAAFALAGLGMAALGLRLGRR
jgi:MFS family permease